MSRVNRNALHSDEVEVIWGVALNFKAQGDRLPNPLHQLIKRFCLGVAAGQGWNRGDKVAVRVLFNDNVKLPSHSASTGDFTPALATSQNEGRAGV